MLLLQSNSVGQTIGPNGASSRSQTKAMVSLKPTCGSKSKLSRSHCSLYISFMSGRSKVSRKNKFMRSQPWKTQRLTRRGSYLTNPREVNYLIMMQVLNSMVWKNRGQNFKKFLISRKNTLCLKKTSLALLSHVFINVISRCSSWRLKIWLNWLFKLWLCSSSNLYSASVCLQKYSRTWQNRRGILSLQSFTLANLWQVWPCISQSLESLTEAKWSWNTSQSTPKILTKFGFAPC